MEGANWAGNLRYSAATVVAPRSVEEVRRAVAEAERAHALGTRHAFSTVADTTGTLVSTQYLNAVGEPDADGAVVVGPGASYGAVAAALAPHGRTLANFASLPHISIGGAVATATHGSGARNQSLASAVRALELVLADGSLHRLERGDPDFDGAVVSLGALGVVTSLTLDTVPAFDLCQSVFEDLPWASAEEGLGELLATGYSTSLFLSWDGTAVEQVWVKAPEAVGAFHGARPATRALNPIASADPKYCTEQLGIPGPAAERLPHFRLDGVPSAGAELQLEYAVGAPDGPAAFRALRAVGAEVAPALHVAEIRAIAADRFWLSPFYERDSVTFHFTWKPDPTPLDAVAAIEEALSPFSPRPHWGKIFSYDRAFLDAVYPRLDDFRSLQARLDPAGKFRNAFLEAFVVA